MINQPGIRAVNLKKVRLLDRLAALNSDLASQVRAVKLDWYMMRNQSSSNGPAEVFIYDEIGGSFGVSAIDFVQELNEIDNPEIVVRINSPGGEVSDGIAIANALVQHPSKITTRVDSMAASIASIIAVSGDVCEVMDGGQLMIHDAMCMPMGNSRDLREVADWLDLQSDNLAGFYSRKAGGTNAEWREKMLAETWMFADEAVELKLADRRFERTKKFDDEPESPEEMTEDQALNSLMTVKHRLTNRGYRFSGRDKAPAPKAFMQRAAATKNGGEGGSGGNIDVDIDAIAKVLDNILGR